MKKIGYLRCNCDVGVPAQSRRYEPVPTYVTVGGIGVQTYAEINGLGTSMVLSKISLVYITLLVVR